MKVLEFWMKVLDFFACRFISGLSFYLYNELATMTIKKTGAVTSSVANTAKRVIVMVWMSPPALPRASEVS